MGGPSAYELGGVGGCQHFIVKILAYYTAPRSFEDVN